MVRLAGAKLGAVVVRSIASCDLSCLCNPWRNPSESALAWSATDRMWVPRVFVHWL